MNMQNCLICHPNDDFIEVESAISIRFNEYNTNFELHEQTRDYWKFVCVDDGELTVRSSQDTTLLTKGDLMFYKPMEYVSIEKTEKAVANYTIVSFYSYSHWLTSLLNKKIVVSIAERQLIAKIIAGLRIRLNSNLNNSTQSRTKRNSYNPLRDQLIKLYLQELLISLVNRCLEGTYGTVDYKPFHRVSSDNMMNQLLSYMDDHITERLKVNTICKQFYISPSQLEKYFRHYCKKGAMEYFTDLKIEYAKKLLLDNNYSITQIAEVLGYSSVNYFSHAFKCITGTNPTRYASSIQDLSENEGF